MRDARTIAEEGIIDAATVRFTQDSIRPGLSAGSKDIYELAKGLKDGSIKAADVPPIRLFWRDNNLYSLDNRRLWSFKKAGVPMRYVIVSEEKHFAEVMRKFTTTNGGTSIKIRGQGQ